ncbi:hypothetical protein NUW54_g935 [Trametes sanguinea]|uniref:Uncharacterized protein n=1 Tax=Trametes sanguinea TaxID=158606 RepID=A0ACC1Q9J1_9APHY|nr:hypothetical protein NUW54_g935 [Trametes sanguinea]
MPRLTRIRTPSVPCKTRHGERRIRLSRQTLVEGYYKNSRLHHLSTWKAELKNLVAEAQERAENGGTEAWNRLSTPQEAPSASQSAVDVIVQQNLGGRGHENGQRCEELRKV